MKKLFRGPTLAGKLFNEEQAKLRVVADRSVFIDNSIKEVVNTAIVGGILAVIVLLLFLRDIRTTAIIALSIPISIFVTFAPLNLLNVSLNIMSLGGLAMGIGMLVDSSIVVLESIYRCREEGDSTRSAAIRGTTEVRGAVIASTLTSICVFFPMVFVEGLAGQVFSDLGLTVVTSLVAALIVAVLFIPMLASRTGFKLQTGAGMVSHALGSLEGRISLAALWRGILLPMGALLTLMVGAKLGYTYWSMQDVDDPNILEKISYGASAMAVVGVWMNVCAWPMFVALAKRLHDRGKSAWWLLTLFPLFEGLFLPGGAGDNRFGPSAENNPRLAKLWGSFRAFDESRKRSGQTFLFTAPYFALRLAISFLLEVIGLSLVWTIRVLAGAALFGYQVLLKIGSLFGRLFSRFGDGKIADSAAGDSGVSREADRWALAQENRRQCGRRFGDLFEAHSLGVGQSGHDGCVDRRLFRAHLVGRQTARDRVAAERCIRASLPFGGSALPVGTPLNQTIAILDGVEKSILEK